VSVVPARFPPDRVDIPVEAGRHKQEVVVELACFLADLVEVEKQAGLVASAHRSLEGDLGMVAYRTLRISSKTIGHHLERRDGSRRWRKIWQEESAAGDAKNDKQQTEDGWHCDDIT
jgi:hypothetical protein